MIKKEVESRIRDIIAKSDLTTVTSKQIRKILESEFEERFEKETTNEVILRILTEVHQNKVENVVEPATEILQQDVNEKVLLASKEESQPVAQILMVPLQKKEEETITNNANVKRSGRKNISSELVELSDDEMDVEMDKKKTKISGSKRIRSKRKSVKTSPRKRVVDRSNSNTGIHRKLLMSPALQEIIKAEKASRPETVKLVWVYIRENNLQDKSDKRYILCDQKLMQITGRKDRVSSFELAKHISNHLSYEEELKSDKETFVNDTKKESEPNIVKKPQNATKRVKSSGLMKPMYLSEKLQKITNCEQLPRTQVVKKLWEYIKINDLQDPADKRYIICDDKLQSVMGKKRISAFEMNRYIGSHLFSETDSLASEDKSINITMEIIATSLGIPQLYLYLRVRKEKEDASDSISINSKNSSRRELTKSKSGRLRPSDQNSLEEVVPPQSVQSNKSTKEKRRTSAVSNHLTSPSQWSMHSSISPEEGRFYYISVDLSDAGRVKVFVRVRPKTSQEDIEEEIIQISPDFRSLKLSSKDSNLCFDGIFPGDSTNKQIFKTIGKPIVKAALSGFNGTLMMYGQTGTGKTYTLTSQDGLSPRLVYYLFKKIQLDSKNEYVVLCSSMQIYNEKIYDLLKNEKDMAASDLKEDLEIRESPVKGIFVENLSEYIVRQPNDVFDLMNIARGRLVFAETKSNRVSSRSHAITILTIQKTHSNRSNVFQGRKSEFNEIPKDLHSEAGYYKANPLLDDSDEVNSDESDQLLEDDYLLKGKITLCDLAGSERLKKTMATGDRLSEAQQINLSLLELGNVIHALTDPKKYHVPFRNSTLTRLLTESLGGNCLTSLIVCVAPCAKDLSETKGTLQFGSRAMRVQNNARVNAEIDYKSLSEKLEKQLKEKDLILKDFDLRFQLILREKQELLDYKALLDKQIASNSDLGGVEVLFFILISLRSASRYLYESNPSPDDLQNLRYELSGKENLIPMLNRLKRIVELILSSTSSEKSKVLDNLKAEFDGFQDALDIEFSKFIINGDQKQTFKDAIESSMGTFLIPNDPILIEFLKRNLQLILLFEIESHLESLLAVFVLAYQKEYNSKLAAKQTTTPKVNVLVQTVNNDDTNSEKLDKLASKYSDRCKVGRGGCVMM